MRQSFKYILPDNQEIALPAFEPVSYHFPTKMVIFRIGIFPNIFLPSIESCILSGLAGLSSLKLQNFGIFFLLKRFHYDLPHPCWVLANFVGFYFSCQNVLKKTISLVR